MDERDERIGEVNGEAEEEVGEVTQRVHATWR